MAYEILGYAILGTVLVGIGVELYVRARQSFKSLWPRGETTKNDEQTKATRGRHAKTNDSVMHSDCLCERCVRFRTRRNNKHSKRGAHYIGNQRGNYTRVRIPSVKIVFA